MSNYSEATKELCKYAKKEKVAVYTRFFKTGKGQYGEGDQFIGVCVPDTRKVAAKFASLPLVEIQQIIKSPVHEERLLALIILTLQFKKADEQTKKSIYDFYLQNMAYVNNWDLVDSSADKIIGEYLIDKNCKDLLSTLSKSKNLWERRVAIIATFQFIKKNQFETSLKIIKLLINDEHDLIHKATGWMLREIGKRDLSTLVAFLDKYCMQMPRTMLRYAIEKLDNANRLEYLNK